MMLQISAQKHAIWKLVPSAVGRLEWPLVVIMTIDGHECVKQSLEELCSLVFPSLL